MLQQLAKLLAPPCCLRCRVEGDLICNGCWEFVFSPQEASCRGMVSVIASGRYAAVLRDLVGRLKYHHQREVAAVVAKALLPCFEHGRFEYNIVTAVPVVSGRLRQRGYNQSELIAKQLSRMLSLPYHPLLARVRITQQVGKSRNERLAHVQGAFIAKGTVIAQNVLVVDDVFTTGATLAECAKTLKNAGAGNIGGAVAALD